MKIFALIPEIKKGPDGDAIGARNSNQVSAYI